MYVRLNITVYVSSTVNVDALVDVSVPNVGSKPGEALVIAAHAPVMHTHACTHRSCTHMHARTGPARTCMQVLQYGGSDAERLRTNGFTRSGYKRVQG